VDISVIVCARNAERTIDQCLESVKRNGPAEIVVVDGDSTDGTVGIARRYTGKVYSDEGRGIACARQMGADKAIGEYVAYVDSDAILPEDTLDTMLNEMASHEYTGIHAQIRSADNKTYWEWAEDQHFQMRFNREGEREALGAIAVIYRRDTILKYGFDPDFSFFGAPEDGDLCYRLREDGLKLGISSAIAYHQHRARARDFVRQRVCYGKGSAQAFWKHRSVKHLAGPSLMVPFGILVCLRTRSLRMLPYYLAWSASGNLGLITRLCQLMLQRLKPGRHGR
jgi:glycosyltransferase involved in cell wall biosynthesis